MQPHLLRNCASSAVRADPPPAPADHSTPGRSRFVERPAPMLGENNREVLGGSLGLSAEELRVLEDKHVIGHPPLL